MRQLVCGFEAGHIRSHQLVLEIAGSYFTKYAIAATLPVYSHKHNESAMKNLHKACGFSLRSSRILFPTLLILALTACATTDATNNTSHPANPSASSENKSKAETQITDAVTSPFSDLNLIRTEIMPVLLAAVKAPYQMPGDQGCEGLATEIRALDLILGPDLDAPGAGSDVGLLEQGQSEVGRAAIGALRGAAEGVIPFRSWIRRLSGAEQHSRDLAAAVAAGIVRRAYLKGLGQAIGCQPPAAPIMKPTILPDQGVK